MEDGLPNAASSLKLFFKKPDDENTKDLDELEDGNGDRTLYRVRD